MLRSYVRRQPITQEHPSTRVLPRQDPIDNAANGIKCRVRYCSVPFKGQMFAGRQQSSQFLAMWLLTALRSSAERKSMAKILGINVR